MEWGLGDEVWQTQLTVVHSMPHVFALSQGKIAIVSKRRALLEAQAWERRLPMLADRLDPHLVCSFAAPGKPEARKELWAEPGTQVYLCSPGTLFNDVRKGVGSGGEREKG